MPAPLVDSVTAAKLDQYLEAQNSGYKIFYGPLYSCNDLAGLARADNPVTNQLNAQTISYFQASEGQTGQGFARPLRESETNLDSAPGQLPGGYSFVGHALGVFMPPQLPPALKTHFTRHSALRHIRHSNVWKCGATVFWPEASFGMQSCAAATTIANTLLEYGVNGAVASRAFPDGGELYYPAKEVIRFDIGIFEPVFVTVDGLTANGAFFPNGNQIPVVDGAPLYVVLEGYRFEKLSA